MLVLYLQGIFTSFYNLTVSFCKKKIKTFVKFLIFMTKLKIQCQLYPGLPPVRFLTEQSGFGVCCPGGRRDLKPDYRMSGFGSNDLIKAVFQS
jgi:hypothetical protein